MYFTTWNIYPINTIWGEDNTHHMVPLGFISVQTNETSPSHLKAELRQWLFVQRDAKLTKTGAFKMIRQRPEFPFLELNRICTRLVTLGLNIWTQVWCNIQENCPQLGLPKPLVLKGLKTHIYGDEIMVMLTSAIVGFEHLIGSKVLFSRQFPPCDNNLLFQTCKYIHSDSLKMLFCYSLSSSKRWNTWVMEPLKEGMVSTETLLVGVPRVMLPSCIVVVPDLK